MQGCAWTICVGLTLSCLSQTNYSALLWAPKAPLLFQLISPLVRRLPWVGEPLLSFSSPHPGALVQSHLPFSFFPFLSFTLPGYKGIFSCPFRCPMSSASVQQILCENCSIFRFILDAPVERDELHVLLIFHLDPSPYFYF